MKALITGASSGFGWAMAKILDKRGYETILVARRKERLDELQRELKNKSTVIAMDIAGGSQAKKLYEKVKDEKIDMVINNAGFGLWGTFADTDLDKELDMIDLNITTVHTLTKLFLQDFKKEDRGIILNVASIAAFMPGPYMPTYYATKAYILHLTEAIAAELRNENSHVIVSVLCPGPAETEFSEVADVHFAMKPMSGCEVAEYAISEVLKGKRVIIPGALNKAAAAAGTIAPNKIVNKFVSKIQIKKKQ